MSLQGELELRAHDLPVSWDGAPVTWRGWEPALAGVVFICPPPKVAPHCSRCGSIEKPIRNRGFVDDDGRQVLQLLVDRCPDCSFDQVWDLEADVWWDLGPEDYGDEGSVPPAPKPEPPPNTVQLSGRTTHAEISKARAAIAAARAERRLF